MASLRSFVTSKPTSRDFRWLIGLYLAGYAAMLGVMAHGFHWL